MRAAPYIANSNDASVGTDSADQVLRADDCRDGEAARDQDIDCRD